MPLETAIQPTGSAFLWTARSVPGAPCRTLRAMAISICSRGMPRNSMATMYTSRKAPPPCLAARPGKRQALPRPTAEPMEARMNAERDDHLSRDIYFSPIKNSTPKVAHFFHRRNPLRTVSAATTGTVMTMGTVLVDTAVFTVCLTEPSPFDIQPTGTCYDPRKGQVRDGKRQSKGAAHRQAAVSERGCSRRFPQPLSGV